MIRIILLGILILVNSVAAFANPNSLNLSLPGSMGSFQSDSFRADGIDCSMAIGSSTNVEFGVVGVINNNNPGVISTSPNMQGRDIGVYGRITIPIGAPKNRLDCNELYQLELRKKRIEVQRLERELQNLKNLRFENTPK
jgi:hypothetical protein